MTESRSIVLAALLLMSPIAAAKDPEPATRPAEARNLSRRERAQQYIAAQRRLLRQFREKDYAGAEATARRATELAPTQPSSHYNLACALARQEKTEPALAALKQAVEAGYDDSDHARKDPDLASLRDSGAFKALLKRMDAPVEPTVSRSDGQKVLTGKAGRGLWYRLRMNPDATTGAPDRLIVWLHPSGGSMNAQVEKMTEGMIEAGWALLVFTRKSFRGWSGADLDRAMRTIRAVGKIDGLDADRPVLMGYSAGGQAALLLWQQKPEAFGGLVLDAAYPLKVTRRGYRKMELPDDEAVKKTPVFVLVGRRDGGAAVWANVETLFREAGLPLTIRYVPGKGHTWLFGRKEAAALMKWLTAVRAGKRPSATVGEPPAPQASATRPAE